MNLKKALIFSLFLAAGSTAAFAQSSNLKKAKTNLQKFEELKSAGSAALGKGNLEGAKEAIELASAHDKTKNDPETWTVYALISANVATFDKSDEAAAKAQEAIAKAKELDSKKEHSSNIEVAGQVLGQYNFNKGIEAWDKQDFTNAYKSFGQALTFLPGDTTLTYYSGLAAIQNKDYPNAIAKYKELVPIKEYSSHKVIMVDLPKLMISHGDTTSALEYAAKAVEAYPNDNDAAVQNIELNLMTNNGAKVVADIENQLTKDPQNKSLLYYLGIVQASLNENDKALVSYKKALAIDPDYIEANTNAAVTIMNGIRDDLNVLNENKTISNNDYNAQVKALKEKVQEALPFLEKVVQLQPENSDALRNLKGYYDFQQDEAKSAEIKAKIDALN